MPTEEELIKGYEEIMSDYQKDDEWDLPAALFIRWDADIKGCIVVIPTADPKEFLELMVSGGVELAQQVFRQIGDVPTDTPIAAMALVNEGWGLDPETSTTEELALVETGQAKISELPSRTETRLCFVVTKDKGVYFGHQNRGSKFEWISRSDDPDGGVAGGLLPYLIYPLVTGEPYTEPEGLSTVRDALGLDEFQDLRFNRGKKG